MNVGTLPTSDITASDVNKVTLEVLNSGSSSMYSREVTEPNVASVDLNGSEIIFKKTYYITVAIIRIYSATWSLEFRLTLEPYDSEDYNVTFDSTGTVESLMRSKLTVSAELSLFS